MHGAMTDWFNFATPVPPSTLHADGLAAPDMRFRQQDGCDDRRQEQHNPPHTHLVVLFDTANRPAFPSRRLYGDSSRREALMPWCSLFRAFMLVTIVALLTVSAIGQTP